jgi:hypothetical protein
MPKRRYGIDILAASIATLVLAPAFGQQGNVEFSTYELFGGPDNIVPKPDVLQRLADVMRQAQPPGNCPLGRLKIRTPEGDPIFQSSVAAARRDAALGTLEGLGLRVAGRLFVESTVFGPSSGHDTVYEEPRDRKPPKLNTTSVPRKGSKVKPGDQIKVTMIARDDPQPWPTGLKQIQLVADTEGRRFIASEAYEPCSQPAERRVEATYVVPANPPSVVRLTAIADDHAGNMEKDVGEFPTYDWSGTLTWSMKTETPGGSWTRFHGSAGLTVYRDNQGKLTGTITGDVKMDGQDRETGLCPSITTATTTNGRAKLEGFHASGATVMTLATKDVELLAQGQTTPCAGTPLPIPGAEFAVMLHTNELRQRPDKSFHASDNTRSNQGGSTVTNEFSLTLIPAGN